VSDNRPPFTSEAHQLFCAGNGICQTSDIIVIKMMNVQTFKNAIRRGKEIGVEKALCQFLLRYRMTPHPSTGETIQKVIVRKGTTDMVNLTST